MKKIVPGLLMAMFLLAGCGTGSTTSDNPPSQAAENSSSTSDTQANTVTYSDQGFTPNTLTIKKGDTVTFLNQSASVVRPASDKHPTHTEYPTTGGCVGSTFDACKGLQPGESWSFQFDEVGQWGYHNHLNPSQKGTIVVEE